MAQKVQDIHPETARAPSHPGRALAAQALYIDVDARQEFSPSGLGSVRARVGEATYIDCTRRTDPARSGVWTISGRCDAHGPPWVLTLGQKPRDVMRRGGEVLEALRTRGTTRLPAHRDGPRGNGLARERQPDAFGEAGDLLDVMAARALRRGGFDPMIRGLDNLERSHAYARGPRPGSRASSSTSCCEPVRTGGPTNGSPKRSRTGGKAARYDRSEGKDRGRHRRRRSALGLGTFCCAEGRACAPRFPPGAARVREFEWFCELSGRTPAASGAARLAPGLRLRGYFDVGLYGRWNECLAASVHAG